MDIRLANEQIRLRRLFDAIFILFIANGYVVC